MTPDEQPRTAGAESGPASAVEFDVVVVGGGVAGLVATRQLAHLGNSVLVVEARDAAGGFVASREVAGVRVDTGAESFATRKGTVAALATELGLGDDIVSPNTAGAWVAWNGGSAPLPASALLGIPGVPLADDVRRIIGWRGVLRAYGDRVMPLLRVRKETDLGDIVRRRMGARVLERLVTPVVAGVHSADPSVVDVHTVAPGLTQAMTTQGSLSGAVMALREQAPAGSAVQGIAGGMNRLVEALEADCRYYDVEVRTETRVTALAAQAAGEGWAVELTPTSAAPDVAPRSVTARAVVVATDFRPGLALLAEAGARAAPAGAAGDVAAGAGAAAAGGAGARGTAAAGGAGGAGGPGGAGAAGAAAGDGWPEPASVVIATLVVDEPRLDAHPRGTGVLVAPGTPGVQAKALTHSSAKWAWLADSLPPHRHVVRLSYGRRDGHPESPPRAAAVLPDRAASLPGEAIALTGAASELPGDATELPGEATATLAAGTALPDQATVLRDASTLLGVPLADADVVGFAVTPWADSLAFATVGHRARVRRLVAAVEPIAGLDVVGAWVSGTGLAATVEHARTTASALAAELRGDPRLPVD